MTASATPRGGSPDPAAASSRHALFARSSAWPANRHELDKQDMSYGDYEDEPDHEGRLIPRIRAAVLNGAASLFPGYFALVMATGVVSIACHLMELRAVALALVGFNWVAWFALWILTVLRALWFRKELTRDISDHQRAPGFFTIVAGTCVLGTQNTLVIGARGVGELLWWFGLILWFAIMYVFFTAVTVRARKPTLKRGINGAWLTAAVSTQSVVVLRAVIDVDTAPPDAIQFQVIAMHLIGCMLYLGIIPLIFYRLTFVPMSREDFSPPYWINMGAVAITALAGSLLILRSDSWPLVAPLVPFLWGFAFFFWAVATWWIPFLFLLMLWRYVWMRDRFTYEPAVWGMIFPMAMYTTSTYQFAKAMGFAFLALIPHTLVFVALGAWLLAAIGLVRMASTAILAPGDRAKGVRRPRR